MAPGNDTRIWGVVGLDQAGSECLNHAQTSEGREVSALRQAIGIHSAGPEQSRTVAAPRAVSTQALHDADPAPPHVDAMTSRIRFSWLY